MSFRNVLLALAVGSLGRPAVAGLIIPKPAEIIRVQPNEIRDFESDFCDEQSGARSGVESIQSICYGHVKFQGEISMRALLVETATQDQELFVEREIAPVELKQLQFDVIGPVNKESGFEVGKVSLEIDHDGEVIAFTTMLPRYGVLVAERP